jgi:formylglycine-generating enzyme required for sulfatase activity
MKKLFIFKFLLCLLPFFASSQNKPQKASLISDIEFVLVEGGSFMMGCEESDKDCYPDEQPKHEVVIATFSISKYEITVAQYRKFCENTNRQMPPEPSFGWQDNSPIVNVSWQDAMQYAQWAGGKLPTEAQWEYAARGGKKSRGFAFSGSNDYNEVGWSYENSANKTHPVGQKQPNELGIYDMSGNAWEWCNDNYGIFYYQESPKNNPQGAAQPDLGKVNRGGGYSFDHSFLKSSARRGSAMSATGTGTGFRIVR